MLLLQTTYADEFIWLLCLVIGIVIGIYFTRWVFKINSILDHLKRQTFELAALRRIVAKISMGEKLTQEDLNKIGETTATEVGIK